MATKGKGKGKGSGRARQGTSAKGPKRGGMAAKKKERDLINYTREGEWSGTSLRERPDGLWVHESWAAIQGCRSGRRVVLRPPEGWTVKNEADMNTRGGGDWSLSKAEDLIYHGTEVRCLRHGHIVQ